ncbi:taste receptor type 1 member 1 isoform X2 [Syngnathoides biaculeatus]|uniref:taste receptor type 1 member 1 isoform X2 n=1 Tax=Syngnathoides biaculeatus TaxID=300417 RepID=UPI002ADE237B|nr:taste receptor type 1 member 1 isoform X2 [Syngnathoides biaculeatus]
MPRITYNQQKFYKIKPRHLKENLVILVTDGELDYNSQGEGLHLQGDFSIAGLFPLHNANGPSAGLPALGPCNEGRHNKHGFHMMQAMRFAIDEINNKSGAHLLLPGVSLGYQLYDICSVPASVLATLDILADHYHDQAPNTEQPVNNMTVAVIGPDSSSKTFTPAGLLGAYLIPQISYEASNQKLSNKVHYPSFFRTIPSDKNQVEAIIQLLIYFKWTWIALLGSDNDYGLDGMESLSQQAPDHNICVAYRGVIPAYGSETAGMMRSMVEGIMRARVNTIVLFSSKSKLSGFFPFVVQGKLTGKVWIGTEDWSTATLISGIPGIHTVGTVIGVSIKNAAISGFVDFERNIVEASLRHGKAQAVSSANSRVCLHSTDVFSLARHNFTLEKYDVTSSFNVYKAVYAVAYALHQALQCDSRRCQKRRLHPWQLLPMLKDTRFSLENTSVYFDVNGDPPTGYDIVTWIWRGTEWSHRVVGSFSPDPPHLTLDDEAIEWHTAGMTTRSVPTSICSPPCPKGHRKLMRGQHACCFDCQACPAATFLNLSEPIQCQPCPSEQWAPASSERCFDRTVLLLAWDAPLAMALLFFLACCLLLTSGSAAVLLLHLRTPVAKSAGGRTCLLMLAALTAAALSSLCHFGPPSHVSCMLEQPLFMFSFSVCLACITVRSVQVVCIFKLASKLPRAYDKWAKNQGPEVTIFIVSAIALLISVTRVAVNPPEPSQDVDFYQDSVVLECSSTLSYGAGVELAYVSLLSVACFSFSYMGKDLPANYNEAKCVTFSLMVYLVSWISFFTIYLVSRGPFTMAAHVFAILFSVLAVLGGYFLPKMYIIVLRPQMNTAVHFQNCIQMYTMSKQ